MVDVSNKACKRALHTMSIFSQHGKLFGQDAVVSS